MTVNVAAPPNRFDYTVRQRAADVLSVTRLHAGSWFALLGLLGAASAAQLSWPTGSEVVCYAIALSCMGFTVNNIADRNRDSRDPRRAGTPVVAGRISIHGALVIAATAELVTLATVVLSTVSPGCRALALALSFLMVIGNGYQKSLGTLAPVADVFFGIGMGLEVLLGHLWAANGTSLTLVLLVVAAGVQMTLLNVTAGNLKDLAADLSSPQTTTTALVLGVRPAPCGGLTLTVRYRALVLALQVCSMFLVIAVGLATAQRESWDIARACLVTGGTVASFVATYGFYRLVTGMHRQVARGRDWYLFVNFAALLLAYAGSLSATARLLIGTASVGALVWEAAWRKIARWLDGLAAGRAYEEVHDTENRRRS